MHSRYTEKMNMVRHDHKVPDEPFVGATPGFAKSGVHRLVIQTMIWTPIAEPNRNHQYNRLIESFYRRRMGRGLSLWQICHIHSQTNAANPGRRELRQAQPSACRAGSHQLRPSRYPARQASPSKTITNPRAIFRKPAASSWLPHRLRFPSPPACAQNRGMCRWLPPPSVGGRTIA